MHSSVFDTIQLEPIMQLEFVPALQGIGLDDPRGPLQPGDSMILCKGETRPLWESKMLAIASSIKRQQSQSK